MNVLVTGTAGFIGYHLARRLLEKGHRVLGLDNINAYYDVRLKYARLAETGIDQGRIGEDIPVRSSKYPSYEFIKMNIADNERLEQAFNGRTFDCICHLAAQAGVRYSLINPHTYVESNITGFVNIIDLCRRGNIPHLVYASSSSVYGLGTAMPFSTGSDTEHPASLYGATKKSDELIAHSYSHLFRLPTTGLRFFTVYGPWGRPDMAAFIFAKAILEGRPIEIYNHGDMERDFTYVDDIIEGIVRVIEKPRPAPPEETPFRIYNIGHGSPVKLLDFVSAIERSLGRPAIRQLLPMQPGDVRATWADTDGLLKDYGYVPTTTVLEGIERFIQWYRSYYRV
jgi:UDP-glucuronate 4-epimerase